MPAAALVRRPEGLGAIEGTAVWMPYITAYGGLVEVGGMRHGDTVVLNAASSSVGLAAVHVAERIGATPIAVTRTAARRGPGFAVRLRTLTGHAGRAVPPDVVVRGTRRR